MRNIIYAVVLSMGILAIALWLACTLMTHPPKPQLHNPYYPFTVETAIKDI